MFTGLVECTGHVAARARRGPSERLTLGASLPDLSLGESIAVSGACLTVVAFAQGRFEVDVSAETLKKTTLGRRAIGARVNLERSLKVGDRLGGHLLAGHVDGLARLVEVQSSGDARAMTFEIPPELARFIAAKGSVALDGVSLTVNTVSGRRFTVMLIPHTLAVTTLGELSPGDELNLEVDQVARYVVRYLTSAGSEPDPDLALRAALERANLV
jgi:riboflavin synthase